MLEKIGKRKKHFSDSMVKEDLGWQNLKLETDLTENHLNKNKTVYLYCLAPICKLYKIFT